MPDTRSWILDLGIWLLDAGETVGDKTREKRTACFA